MDHIKKLSWQEFAKLLDRSRVDNDWSVSDLVDEYHYSRGKVSCYLNLAAALRVYPELKHMDNVTEAIGFLKKKKFHRGLES